MADQAESCLAALCGACCVAITGCFQAWCNTKQFGSGGCCGGQTGCCGSCCNKSFNEDSFEEAQRKEAERKAQDAKPVDSQPEATAEMLQGEDKAQPES